LENISGNSLSWSMANVFLEGNKTKEIRVMPKEICKNETGEKQKHIFNKSKFYDTYNILTFVKSRVTHNIFARNLAIKR